MLLTVVTSDLYRLRSLHCQHPSDGHLIFSMKRPNSVTFASSHLTNFNTICPSTPRSITPTFVPRHIPQWRRGDQVVIPDQSKGNGTAPFNSHFFKLINFSREPNHITYHIYIVLVTIR